MSWNGEGAPNSSTWEGEVGLVYKTPTGSDLAEAREYTEGWLQRTRMYRIKVKLIKISHSAFEWKPVVKEQRRSRGGGWSCGSSS